VLAARRRGIWFDFGNGVNDHFDWATVEKATKQDFWPDTFSTDWSVASRTTGVVDMPNVMSKLIMFGMPISQVIAAGTCNAARIFPSFDDRGTLNVGARRCRGSWSCATEILNSSTTTKARAPAAAAVPDRDRAQRQETPRA
jgi:predicted amidohydrolase